jgi:hypothetical protein
MADSAPPPPTADPSAPKPLDKADAMAALKLYVDLANSERQAIWARHATMLVGNTLMLNAARPNAANPDAVSTLLFNGAGLLLCVVWALMTWYGWGWFYDAMEKGNALPVDKSLNPFANIPDISVRRKDSIFIFAMMVVAIFATVYFVNLWPPAKALICGR